MASEVTKKKLLKTLLDNRFPETDDPITQFLSFNEFYTQLCKHIDDAYGIGYGKGFEEGVNYSIQVKKN